MSSCVHMLASGSDAAESDDTEIETDSAVSDDTEIENGLWEKISFIWVIRNIASHFKVRPSELVSPKFYNKGKDFIFKIVLYYPGAIPSDLLFLDLLLSGHTIRKEKTKTKYMLSFTDSEDRIIETKGKMREFGNSWAYSQVIKLSYLLAAITDNILKIHVKVLIQDCVFETGNSVFIAGPDSPERRLQKNMGELFKSSTLADVVFEVKGAKLEAHRCVLAARSPVFAAMFAHENIDKISGVVKIADFDTDTFARFLRFVYCGDVDIPSVDAAIELFQAGEKYFFPDLQLLCKNFISINLDMLNVWHALYFAETFGVEDLKESIHDYMRINIKAISDTKMDEFNFLEEKNPELLTEMLVMVAEYFGIENDS